MANSTNPSLSIPVIDLAPAHTGSKKARLKTAKELYEAFRTTGFAYVKNHGVPEEIINKSFEWSHKFFNLPQNIKDAAPRPETKWHQRGYTGIGREKLSQMIFDRPTIDNIRKVPDAKEAYDMGRNDDDYMPNVWIAKDALPGFQEFFLEFFEFCYEAELEMLRLVALGMDLDEDFLVGYHKNKDNQIRIAHYPPVEEELLQQGKVERIGAHTDFGSMTMLWQDETGGLEVEDIHEKNKWNPAPHIPGAALVNIGDFLMRWSNDELKSTMHRVQAPPLQDRINHEVGGRMSKARFSVMYFWAADREKTVDCLPGCFGPDRPKRYEPINSIEYINRRVSAIY